MSNILVINLQNGTADCFLCGVETPIAQGIETYEGEIYDPAQPWMEPGFVSHACLKCYEAHQRAKQPD